MNAVLAVHYNYYMHVYNISMHVNSYTSYRATCNIKVVISCMYVHSSFVRPEILEQLVKLITLEPEENAEDKVKFKSVIA